MNTVPKREYDFPPGELLDEDKISLVKLVGSSADLERLQKLGGRLTVALAIPLPVPKDQRAKADLSPEGLEALRLLSREPDRLRSLLHKYSVSDLHAIAASRGLRFSKKMARVEVANDLVRSFCSESVWKGIMGEANSESRAAESENGPDV